MGRRASDLLVEGLEAEGVRWVFGIPGEETFDLSESLERSGIEFVPVRHEQGGALIADVIGRAGVAVAALGPGATNLVTGVADAYPDYAPLVVLTGQNDLERIHKKSHQYIDVLSLMRPVRKWNARVSDQATVPEAVRKAFAVADRRRRGFRAPPGACSHSRRAQPARRARGLFPRRRHDRRPRGPHHRHVNPPRSLMTISTINPAVRKSPRGPHLRRRMIR